MSRKNKTISFNLDDPHELELFEHAEKINPLTGKQQNFSKYVKRLIEDDIRKKTQSNIIFTNNHEEDTSEIQDAMSSFL